MKMSDNAIKMINDVAAPFAVATTFLFSAFVLLEYFRRGFVTVFLDLRYFSVLVIVFTTMSAVTIREMKNSRLEKIFIALVFIFAVYVIINIALPFGRLGLVVIGCGVLTLTALYVSLINFKPNR